MKRIKEPPPEFFRFQTFYNMGGAKRSDRCSVCQKSISSGIHDLGLDILYCHDHADEDGRRFTSVCVDPVRHNPHGGKFRASCHLFVDDGGVDVLHKFAELIGLRRSWFQEHPKYPHYDLSVYKREQAVKNGAKEVGRRVIIQTGGGK